MLWSTPWFKRATALRRRNSAPTSTETLEDRTLLSINIVFDYTYDTAGFFSDPDRKAVLEAAGRSFEDAFSDSLSAISPSGINSWTNTSKHPETGASLGIYNATIAADVVLIYVGSRDLSGSTIGVASTGYSWSGTSGWGDIVEFRGQTPSTLMETGPFGGTIAFDSMTSWHFGLTTSGLGSGESDFYSTAIHEIGHLMGISSGDNSWTNQISGGTFNGTNVKAVNGGVGAAASGGHWADGLMSDGREVTMSPSGLSGTRGAFTTLDWAAMDDVGWTLTFDESVSGDKPGHVVVRVVDENGDPVSGKTVSLAPSSGNTGTANLSSGTTDEHGLFSTFVTGASWDVTVDGTAKTLVVDGGMQAAEFTSDSTPEDDVFVRNASTGRWYIGVSTGTSFGLRTGPAWSTAVTWTILEGDFNGDGKIDIAGQTSTGQWWVGLSDGSTFNTSFWLNWSGTAGWTDWQVGDFNGDGMDDVTARTSSGEWWIGRSTGSAFTNVYGGRWASTGWEDVVSGDFDGDGKDDLAGRRTNGDWYFALQDGTRFVQSYAGHWSGTAGWQDVLVGDYDDDGKDDIFARTSGGTWWIGKSTGATLSTTYGTQWVEGSGWNDVVVGDFDGDGKADIAGRTDAGTWHVARSTGSALSNSVWAQWNAATAWTVAVGDFDGDGKDDLAGYIASTGDWWVAIAHPELRFTNTYFKSWGSTVASVNYLGGGDMS